MCVAAIAWDAHPDWLLVVAGNRDEYHARPAAPLARWPDGIVAGKDLTGSGTWLGVHEEGRFALVTNYRVPQGPQPGRPSRGKLVTDLLGGIDPMVLAGPMTAMNPFNLILADHGQAWFVTNYPEAEQRPLTAGIHGLSNGGFDTPWPKTLQVQGAIEHWMESGDADCGMLLDALRDETPAPDPRRPELGPEARFAPVFIRDDTYGTRCSTVIAINRAGTGWIIERSFDFRGLDTGIVRLQFGWPIDTIDRN